MESDGNMETEMFATQIQMFHSRPPKAMEDRIWYLKDNWMDFKREWKYFEGSGILKGKNKSQLRCTFLLLIGTAGSRYIETIDPDDKIKDVKELIKKLDEYYAPKKNVIIERHNFNTSYQDAGESFKDYYTKIRESAKSCEWPITEEDGLRDKIVQGIRDVNLKKKLLCKADLTLQEAVDICTTEESASALSSKLITCEQKRYNSDEMDINVDKIKKKFGGSDKTRRYDKEWFCNSCAERHGYGNCPAFRETCRNCKRKGHYAKCCRYKPIRLLEEEGPNDSEVEVEIENV